VEPPCRAAAWDAHRHYDRGNAERSVGLTTAAPRSCKLDLALDQRASRLDRGERCTPTMGLRVVFRGSLRDSLRQPAQGPAAKLAAAPFRRWSGVGENPNQARSVNPGRSCPRRCRCKIPMFGAGSRPPPLPIPVIGPGRETVRPAGYAMQAAST